MANTDVRKRSRMAGVQRRAGFSSHGMALVTENTMRAEARTPFIGVAASTRVAIVGLLSLAALAGCGKSDSSSVTQPVATSQPTKPAPAVLDIGGEPTEFAVTHLDIVRDQASLNMQLYGSDGVKPPKASFYFDLTLEGDDPAQLPGQTWQMSPTKDLDEDDSVGIFLNGTDLRLQPKAVQVVFGGEYPNLTVSLTGTFLRDGDDSKEVKASGTFTVHAKEKAAN